MVRGLRIRCYSIFFLDFQLLYLFSIFSCSAWSTWLDRCTSPTGTTRLNKTRVPPPVVLRFLTPYTLASCLKNLFLWNLSIFSIPFASSPPFVFYLTPCLAPPPPHRSTHKTSGFKTSGFKTSGFKNVRFTKHQVYKTPGFKTSGFKTSGFRTAIEIKASKRPVSKFDLGIKQKV